VSPRSPRSLTQVRDQPLSLLTRHYERAKLLQRAGPLFQRGGATDDLDMYERQRQVRVMLANFPDLLNIKRRAVAVEDERMARFRPIDPDEEKQSTPPMPAAQLKQPLPQPLLPQPQARAQTRPWSQTGATPNQEASTDEEDEEEAEDAGGPSPALGRAGSSVPPLLFKEQGETRQQLQQQQQQQQLPPRSTTPVRPVGSPTPRRDNKPLSPAQAARTEGRSPTPLAHASASAAAEQPHSPSWASGPRASLSSESGTLSSSSSKRSVRFYEKAVLREFEMEEDAKTPRKLRRASNSGSAYASESTTESSVSADSLLDPKTLPILERAPPELRFAPNLRPAAPERSILKKQQVRQETFEEVMVRVFTEREREAGRLLGVLVKGAVLKKYNSMQTSDRRWFEVSADGTELRWSTQARKPDGSTKSLGWFGGILPQTRVRYLADVQHLRYGTYYSQRFARYNQRGKPPWLGFSLFFEDRTLDIVCADEHEVTMWFLGLQSLAPLTQDYLSKGALLWERAKMKVEYQAQRLGTDERALWLDMIAEARKALRSSPSKSPEAASAASASPPTKGPGAPA
jgi:hypothetical protein